MSRIGVDIKQTKLQISRYQVWDHVVRVRDKCQRKLECRLKRTGECRVREDGWATVTPRVPWSVVWGGGWAVWEWGHCHRRISAWKCTTAWCVHTSHIQSATNITIRRIHGPVRSVFTESAYHFSYFMRITHDNIQGRLLVRQNAFYVTTDSKQINLSKSTLPGNC